MKTTAALAALVLGIALSAPALDRVAFVLGNDAYPDAPLTNAVRDARAVKEMLTAKLGFPEAGVVSAEDADRLAIFEKFDEFKKKAAGAEIVVVFYAGHGMESLDGKENFLLPVDVPVARAAQSEAVLRATGVNLMALCSELADTTSGAKVVLMDCCRERPAGRGSNRAGGGLVTYADADIPADTLMILAAAPNRVASDGAGHGPFTEALLEVLPGNGGNLMDAFFAVSDRVRETTRQTQIPWLKFDGSGQIFRQQKFLATAPAAVAAPPAMPAVPAAPAAPVQTAADRLRGATRDAPFVNSLGLEFVPVPGKAGVWMCRTETRVRDFRAYAEATDYVPRGGAYVLKFEDDKPTWKLDGSASWEKPGFTQSEDHAVTCVSWEEARAMAGWLSSQEKGLTYRLPTDAEWSAAVGSVGKIYPWGNAWPPPKGAGNYFGKEGPKSWPGSGWKTAYDHDDGAEKTARVASYAENRFGFYDLGGNVWEWCEDLYRASMNDADALEAYPGLKNEKANDGTPYRVVRGGSWSFPAEIFLRSSYRHYGRPSGRYVDRGFRLVVVVGVGG